jgi:hypothetical protein
MKAICLIVWMIISLVLVCTVIGLLLFYPKDVFINAESTPSTWCLIGRKLLNSVTN